MKFILSQPAGAGPDILARYVGEQLTRLWSQAVVVENRPGGQNVIGAQAAARSPADGHTFYYATTAALVLLLDARYRPFPWWWFLAPAATLLALRVSSWARPQDGSC